MKDHLKARGYRWSDGSDGRPKSWWIEVAEEALDDELITFAAGDLSLPRRRPADQAPDGVRSLQGLKKTIISCEIRRSLALNA